MTLKGMVLIEGELDEIIATSVDKSLDAMGRGFRSIFYWSLENRVGMKRNELISKPEEFALYLDRMFPSGASLLKEEISDQICKDLGIDRRGDEMVKLMKRLAASERGRFSRS